MKSYAHKYSGNIKHMSETPHFVVIFLKRTHVGYSDSVLDNLLEITSRDALRTKEYHQQYLS